VFGLMDIRSSCITPFIFRRIDPQSSSRFLPVAFTLFIERQYIILLAPTLVGKNAW
jgi:hypothetical protein